MNQSHWLSQQPYLGYETQELENSHPTNQNSPHQMLPTTGNHFNGSKSVNSTNQHYLNGHQPTVSTGNGYHHPTNLESRKSKDQRLAAAKQRYRQIPRDESHTSVPSSVGYGYGFSEDYHKGYPPTPTSTGYQVPSAPYSPFQSFSSGIQAQHEMNHKETTEEDDLRNERRRCLERRRRQNENGILAQAEYSTDPYILEKAEEIRARRKRKEDRAQERYKNLPDDKKWEIKQRKKMQQQLRDLKKKQEEEMEDY